MQVADAKTLFLPRRDIPIGGSRSCASITPALALMVIESPYRDFQAIEVDFVPISLPVP